MLTLTKSKSRIHCNILTVLAKPREAIVLADTVTYSYDDLNRMTQAVATNVASGQSTYTQNFTYNAIGNITAGPVGSYTYAGTGYANPHAATSINSVTNTYDNAGSFVRSVMKTSK